MQHRGRGAQLEQPTGIFVCAAADELQPCGTSLRPGGARIEGVELSLHFGALAARHGSDQLVLAALQQDHRTVTHQIQVTG